MSRWTFERLGALAGLVFIVLSLVGDLSSGNPPGTDDSPAKIVNFFDHHHRGVIASAILTGIAGPFFVWFIAAVALRLRAAGQTAWGIAVFGLALAGLAAGFAADALYGALGRIAIYGDANLTRAVYELDGFFTLKSFWFAAGALLLVAIAIWRTSPRWYALVSLAAAVVCGLGGITVRHHGFLAPLGGMTEIAFLGLLVWIVASAGWLWRPPQPAVAP